MTPSRRRILILAATACLLAFAAVHARAADALELGGPEARAFLERLAKEHEEIRDLIKTFDLVSPKASGPV